MAHAALSLNVRAGHVPIDDQLRRDIKTRLERALDKHAPFIERSSVRFSDVNGPRGGVDTVCTVKVVLDHVPSVVVEARRLDARHAFSAAVQMARTAVARAIGRSARGKGGRPVRKPRREQAARPKPRRPESLIGRREGQATQNLERALERPEKTRRDTWVDTALPGMSATDRRAGAGSTARRNTKRRTRGMSSALEGSIAQRPSRKSTRRSANRTKQGGVLTREQKKRTRSAKARALRHQAKK
jgi:hypothetical protein